MRPLLPDPPGDDSPHGEQRESLDHALPAIYNELRRVARYHLRRERAGHTLNTTSLVHEAYLRLVGIGMADWTNRSNFLGMASRTMRRVLIDYARARSRRGWDEQDVLAIETAAVLPAVRPTDLLALDEALTRLEARNARQCRVVECRFFGGLTHEETAAALGISPATVKRDWTLARAWLNAELSDRGVAVNGGGGSER